jgi:hypothetical protein
VIWHKKYIRPTAWEQLRIDAVMKGGCYVSLLRKEMGLAVPTSGRVEYHHIVESGKRLGHLYGFPLHDWYHRGVVPHSARSKKEARERYGASLADGKRAFVASHGLTEREFWESLQRALGQSTEWPATKILPRRVA